MKVSLVLLALLVAHVRAVNFDDAIKDYSLDNGLSTLPFACKGWPSECTRYAQELHIACLKKFSKEECDDHMFQITQKACKEVPKLNAYPVCTAYNEPPMFSKKLIVTFVVVGIVLLVVFIIGIVVFIWRRKKKAATPTQSTSIPSGASTTGTGKTTGGTGTNRTGQ